MTQPKDTQLRLEELEEEVRKLRHTLAIHQLRFEDLEKKLQHASATHADLRYGRPAAIHTLSAVLTFLRAAGADASMALLSPLHTLLEALQDLEQGIQRPLLTTIKKGGRPPASQTQAFLKGLAAASADFLMNEAGWKKRRACSWVSDKLHRHGFARDDGKPITHATIAEWRDALRNASDEDPQWLQFKELRQSLAAQCNARWLWAPTSQDGIATSLPAKEAMVARFLAEFVPLMGGIKNPENPTPFPDSD